ncbi:MAG: hypothetical protein QOG54_2036 [Actinomycetota bacterium]|jgi:PPOX class probable F420-dependent enzyme|nr:hypothetical protein [Actinomycetota bacterium]
MIDETVKRFAQAANFGTIATLLKDGSPITHVMWVDCDDEFILINTEVHRRKYKNIKRDPRVSVAIWDDDDPTEYVEIRGRVVEEVRGDEARDHIEKLSQKYEGKTYTNEIVSERVILKIAPERQRTYV